MVVGASHGGISVGEVESQHTEEVKAPVLSYASFLVAGVDTICCCAQPQ